VRVANDRVRQLEAGAERKRAAALQQAQIDLLRSKQDAVREAPASRSAAERRWSLAGEAAEAARAVTAWVDNGLAGEAQARPPPQFNFEDFRKAASRQIDLKRQRILVTGPVSHGQLPSIATPRSAPSLKIGEK
jgi:alkanesulfonate monooxygenase SsuD/methylene tetrahydromethanopterin reductase-like flavin-dependent oxidoreductase (luciferase family)